MTNNVETSLEDFDRCFVEGTEVCNLKDTTVSEIRYALKILEALKSIPNEQMCLEGMHFSNLRSILDSRGNPTGQKVSCSTEECQKIFEVMRDRLLQDVMFKMMRESK